MSAGRTQREFNWAVVVGDLAEVERTLKEGADPNVIVPNSEGEQWPLETTIYYRHAEVFLCLLKHGANPNVSTKPGLPLLSLAARRWGWAVEELLNHGANPNAQDNEGRTALHEAALGYWSNDPSIVPLLFKSGASALVKDKRGKTPRQWVEEAYQSKYAELVERLRAAEANEVLEQSTPKADGARPRL